MVAIGQLYSAELEASKIIFTPKGFISGMIHVLHVVHVGQNGMSPNPNYSSSMNNEG